MSKEQNFVSAVVYLDSKSLNPEKFIGGLVSCLDEHFLHYEVIAVNNGASEDTRRKLQGIKSESGASMQMSIINMSLRQSREQCMNAGLDLSAGDYVYEFDSDEGGYDFALVWNAYQEAMKGNDIVAVCPSQESALSQIFYGIFNAYSNSAYKLRTNAFTLISRRALNRAHDLHANLAYRKAVYASIGLKMSVIEFPGSITNRETNKLTLAADSLTLYTDFGYKFSLNFALAMMIITLAEMIYTVCVWIGGSPVSGWTTTMFVLTLGLAGIFAAFALTLKYLTLIIKLYSNKHDYLIEEISKI